MTGLLLLIPAAPLAAALLIPGLGRRAAGLAAVLATGASLVAVAFLLAAGGETTVAAGWGRTGGLALDIGLRFAPLSGAAALLVAGISLPVLVYSLGYMQEEEGRGRYFAGMSLFVGAMLALVLADTLLLLFAAWEWVGFASWLLIGFHYRDPAASRAAQQAFLVTRAGDAAFFLGWLLAAVAGGSADIAGFLDRVQAGAFPPWLLTLMGFLFFAGAVGKSAQLPLSAWLPPAMAGPTPVSALLHSATMVAAGVYLLLRLWPLFAAAPAVLTAVLWVGGATALCAALVASAQSDLKRILAWSTVSQLGEMMLALGLAGPLAAAFHLGTHAAFKSSLFLAAGVIDKATGSRDLHRLGQLWRTLPWTAGAFALAALALAGFPPFAGFWSEEAILAAAVAAPLAAGVLVLAIFLAGVYIGRAAAAVFAPRPGAPSPNAGRPPATMRWSVLLLALLAAASGALLKAPLERFLPFAAHPEAGWGWRAAAIAAAILGLAFGAWRVRRAGPVPAFGAWPVFLDRTLATLTAAPAQGVLALARGIDRLERVLDRLSRGFSAALALGRAIAGLETSLDAGARVLARAIFGLAGGSGAAEARGFGAGLDTFGRGLLRAGDTLRAAETGKVYLYNLGFFAWVFFIVALALILMIW